jgi:hypothetical protein
VELPWFIGCPCRLSRKLAVQSIGKFQFPHHCLETRLLAQRVGERIGFHKLQPGIAAAHGGFKVIQCAVPIAPLRVDPRIGDSAIFTLRSAQFRKRAFRIFALPDPVVGDRCTDEFGNVRGTLARLEGIGQITVQIVSDSEPTVTAGMPGLAR